jgi:hypothetical protein
MGKWLGGLITTLIVLGLTTWVAALLKGPIDDWASQDRLRAEVQLSPWYERPVATPVRTFRHNKAMIDPTAAAIAEAMVRTTDASDFGLARLIVINESNKPVTNANVRLRSPYSASDAVIIGPNGKKAELHNVDRITIPDLNPGDRAVAFLWGDFSTYTFSDSFRTYSSEGRFRVTYDWPTAQDREYESWIGRTIDDYAEMFVAGCVALLLAMFGILAVVNTSYYKLLLKDKNHYKEERRRFLAAPEKFEPKYDKSASPPASPAPVPLSTPVVTVP